MEELNLGLQLQMPEVEKEETKQERVAVAKAKKKVAQHEPTWEEIWYIGYGKKKGIFQTKISDLDKKRLEEVKSAIDVGELGMGVETMKKFSKAHALNLYKQLMDSRKDSIILKMVANTPKNYFLIDTLAGLNKLVVDLKNETETGLDTETNGLDFDLNHIVGLSITLPKADYHVYIPVRHENEGITQLNATFVFEALREYLENELIGKVLHNAKFDFHMFWREGIYVKGLLMDTMIAMKILNENELSYALKNLVTKYGRYFGFEDKSSTYEELFGKGGFENTPLDIGLVYACKDTHVCYEFYKWMCTQFDRLPDLKHIYFDIELPNTITAFDMEKNGLLVDLDFSAEYTITLKEKVQGLEAKLAELFGDININSNDQLGKVLYDDWQLEDVSRKRSVDADTIKYLAQDNENLKLLLEYRELNKLLTTYFETLPTKIWTKDGRLHGSFNQTGTSTGRYSANNPNMQNIPPEARPMFVAPKGKVILGKDLSQIEPRCLAFMSKDSEFQLPYYENTDLYSTLAAKVFKLDMSFCLDGQYNPQHTFQPRKRMKTALLAAMYGTSTYTLSKSLGITMEEAVQFLEDFLNNYPECRDYLQSIRDFVDKNEYVVTHQGRKRRFPHHKEIAVKYHAVVREIEAMTTDGKVPSNIWQSELPYKVKQRYWSVAKLYGRVARQAVNAVIQGSSADYIKQVMLRVNNYLKSLGDEYKMVATIHDEILIEVPDTISVETIAELDRIMTSIEWFDFPIKTDTVVMYAWGQEISVAKWLADRESYNLKRTA